MATTQQDLKNHKEWFEHLEQEIKRNDLTPVEFAVTGMLLDLAKAGVNIFESKELGWFKYSSYEDYLEDQKVSPWQEKLAHPPIEDNNTSDGTLDFAI